MKHDDGQLKRWNQRSYNHQNQTNASWLHTIIIQLCKHTSMLSQIQAIIHQSRSIQQNQYGKNCYQNN